MVVHVRVYRIIPGLHDGYCSFGAELYLFFFFFHSPSHPSDEDRTRTDRPALLCSHTLDDTQFELSWLLAMKETTPHPTDSAVIIWSSPEMNGKERHTHSTRGAIRFPHFFRCPSRSNALFFWLSPFIAAVRNLPSEDVRVALPFLG